MTDSHHLPYHPDDPAGSLIPCPHYHGLRLLPERCADLYRETQTYRQAIRHWGFTGYINGRLLHPQCLDCEQGRELAHLPPPAEPVNRQKRQRPIMLHRKPKDLSRFWKDKYPSEADWLLAMLQEHRMVKNIVAAINGAASWDLIRRRIEQAGIPLVKGKGYVE